MNILKNSLRQIIIDRIDMVRKLNIVQRDFQFEDYFPYVLTGVRRSGKSFMLYQIMHQLIRQGHQWDEFLYINFEDERLIGFRSEDFNAIFEVFHTISDKEPILFLDEIQNVEGWEKFARRIADEKRIVYITGSNASVLSKEIESTLGGRYLTKQIYPYNFAEFLRAVNHVWDKRSLHSSREQGQLLVNFNEFMVYGGFPEVPALQHKRDYLSSVYNKIFLGDVIARNQIANTKALEILAMKIAESVRQPISYSRLANIVQSVGVSVSKTTIIQYVEHLKDAYLLFAIENFSSKIVERTSNPKYYFVDTGLLNLFMFDADPALLENVVAAALVRKYRLENVYFYQDRHSEIDFYVPDGSLAIQVSYSIQDEATRKRELEGLVKFNQFMRVKKNIILTYEEEYSLEAEGIEIQVLPVYKWLLDGESA